MKKFCNLLIVALLLIVSGCTKPPTRTAEEFDAYLDNLLKNTFSSENYAINFSFENPENFGIEQGLYVLGFTSKEEYEAQFDFYEEAIKELDYYPDNLLTKQQRYDRDAMVDYYQRQLPMRDFYEFEVGNSNLGYLLSTNTQLSVYLDVFALRTKLDVDGYLNIMKTLPDYFQKYIDLENQRQASGTGYGKEEIEKIAKQAQETADSINQDYFLVQSFNKRVDRLEFLTQEEKETYKKKNQELLVGPYKEAYQKISDQLTKIDAKESKSIKFKTNGEAYYQALFNRETGVTQDLSSVEKSLKNKYNKLIGQLSIVMAQHPEYNDMMLNPQYKPFENYDEMMQYILNAVKTSNDFPEVNEYNYEIRKVDQSMEKNSSPAFYFTPTVDYKMPTSQFIYYNGAYKDSNFLTMAHEGAPGHMYQFNYFLTLQEHPVRMVYTSSANAEGWAVYAENFATRYYTTEAYANFSSLYQQLVNIIYTQMEIGVNVTGWTYSEFKEKFSALFSMGEENEEQENSIKETYLHFVHNPTNYAMYFMSYLTLNDIKEEMKKDMGDKFKDYYFHEMFLQNGSTSYDVIRKHMKEYVASVLE